MTWNAPGCIIGNRACTYCHERERERESERERERERERDVTGKGRPIITLLVNTNAGAMSKRNLRLELPVLVHSPMDTYYRTSILRFLK